MYSIQYTAEKTGLSSDVIRIWERRYNAVTPRRSAGNQRLYDDGELLRLRLLKLITRQGHRISAVAHLSTAELESLLIPTVTRASNSSSYNTDRMQSFQAAALNCILEFDSIRLQRLITRTLNDVGRIALLQNHLESLVTAVDLAWQRDELRTSQKNFATAFIKTYLRHAIVEINTPPCSPTIVISTPPDQHHTLGGLMSAVCAAQYGWRSIYLDTATPPEELVFCAQTTQAKLITISLGVAVDNPAVPNFITTLANHCPTSCNLAVGGITSNELRAVLVNHSIPNHTDLASFATYLLQIR